MPVVINRGRTNITLVVIADWARHFVAPNILDEWFLALVAVSHQRLRHGLLDLVPLI